MSIVDLDSFLAVVLRVLVLHVVLFFSLLLFRPIIKFYFFICYVFLLCVLFTCVYFCFLTLALFFFRLPVLVDKKRKLAARTLFDEFLSGLEI